MKKLLFLLYATIINCSVFAYTFDAGEITYRSTGGLTYEFTVKIYTNSTFLNYDPIGISYSSGASEDTISFTGVSYLLDSSMVCMVYVGTHTYPSSGTYTISVEGASRGTGIANIPNSMNIPFYIETQLIIDPFLGVNNSSVFLNPAVEKGNVGIVFHYNPSAYDSDGDSISCRLIPCKGESGNPIPGYSLPPSANTFTLESLTGELLWDFPEYEGDYNIAILVEEWRQGIRVGYVFRETQFLIRNSNSINENSSDENNFSIYPNPANDFVTLSMPQLKADAEVYVFNSIGTEVLKRKVSRNETSVLLDVSALPAGMYFVKANKNSGKFVK